MVVLANNWYSRQMETLDTVVQWLSLEWPRVKVSRNESKWAQDRGDGGPPKPQILAGHASWEPRRYALKSASWEGGAGAFQSHFQGKKDRSMSQASLESVCVMFTWMVFLSLG